MLNYDLNNGILTIYFVGEINSTNSLDINNELLKIVNKNKFNHLVLDFNELTYISSAGLRIILSLKKMTNSLEIKGCSLDVYDVFDMTGFTQLITISKKLKEISVEGCKIIGEGRAGIVYRIDKDTIVKVYKRAPNLEAIQKELDLSKQAFILGIPTAISYDIVKVGDKFAARYEMLDCLNLRDYIADHPEHIDEYIEKWADLVKKINSTTPTISGLANKKNKWLDELSCYKGYLDKDLYNKLEKMVQNIKDYPTFIHGDCHPKNIMFNGNELFLIDMGSLSIGNPIFEIAPLNRTFRMFEMMDKGNAGRFFELDPKLTEEIFQKFLRLYFDNYNEDVQKKIDLVSSIYFGGWIKRYRSEDEELFKKNLELVIKLTNSLDDLNIW